jgi:broad-specificity NMP kinase
MSTIIIVSGLPRSGTSMMMRMLEAGGIQTLTDNIRKADEDNLKGYFEFERVKKIEHDKLWLKEAENKAVKLISALLKHLPHDYNYKIIFMKRDLGEILASQKKMLERRGESLDPVPDKYMANLFKKHLSEVENWLKEQPNIKTLYVSYNDTLKNPQKTVKNIINFLNRDLDLQKMTNVIDPSLYRQRKI